ncbi:hypothetical protein Aduo_011789 [Ancylostoma duodenale]
MSGVDIINTMERILILETNVNTHRRIIDQHIFAAMNTNQDNITIFVDHLHQFSISLVRLEHLLQAATAACAEAHLIYQQLTKRLRAHFTAQKPLQGPDTATTEEATSGDQWAPITAIPSHHTSTATTTLPSSSSASTTQSAATRTTSHTASASTATEPRTTTSSTSVTRPSTAPIPTRYEQPKRPRLSPQPSTSSRGSAQSPSRASTLSTMQATSTIPRIPPEGYTGCFFCGEHHYSADCTQVTSLVERSPVLRVLATVCVAYHSPTYCRREKDCIHCGSHYHHNALCSKNRYVKDDIAGNPKLFYDQMTALAHFNYEEQQSTKE